jgi:hypothetical protein
MELSSTKSISKVCGVSHLLSGRRCLWERSWTEFRNSSGLFCRGEKIRTHTSHRLQHISAPPPPIESGMFFSWATPRRAYLVTANSRALVGHMRGFVAASNLAFLPNPKWVERGHGSDSPRRPERAFCGLGAPMIWPPRMTSCDLVPIGSLAAVLVNAGKPVTSYSTEAKQS